MFVAICCNILSQVLHSCWKCKQILCHLVWVLLGCVVLLCSRVVLGVGVMVGVVLSHSHFMAWCLLCSFLFQTRYLQVLCLKFEEFLAVDPLSELTDAFCQIVWSVGSYCFRSFSY